MREERQKYILRLFKEGKYFLTPSADLYSNYSRWGVRKYPKKLKPSKTGLITKHSKGYYSFDLPKLNNKRCCAKRSQLMVLYFRGLFNSKFQINHIDGDTLNDELSNLEVVSASENVLHGYRKLGHGYNKNNEGSKNHMSKLVEADVEFIRASKLSRKELSEKFKVSVTAIRQVILKERWRNL